MKVGSVVVETVAVAVVFETVVVVVAVYARDRELWLLPAKSTWEKC